MKNVRVVITGAVGAGKSTFIRTVSDVDIIEIERSTTDEISSIKPTTTVAFDLGRVILHPDTEIKVYGTPGQSRFDFMWDILISDAHFYIVLVAAHRPNDFYYARQIISFMDQRVKIPMLIGITHTDCAGALDKEEIIKSLGYTNEQNLPPVILVNPTNKSSAIEALKHLISA